MDVVPSGAWTKQLPYNLGTALHTLHPANHELSFGLLLLHQFKPAVAHAVQLGRGLFKLD